MIFEKYPIDADTSREVISKIRRQEGVVKIDKSIMILYQTKKLLKGMLNSDPSKE